jgi:hypothetical protein
VHSNFGRFGTLQLAIDRLQHQRSASFATFFICSVHCFQILKHFYRRTTKRATGAEAALTLWLKRHNFRKVVDAKRQHPFAPLAGYAV